MKNLYQKAKKGAKTLALIGLVSLAGVQLGKSILENAEWERTRREVQLMIDTDKNKIITRNEWAPVYKFLGVEPQTTARFGPSALREDSMGFGTDLTTPQLKQYLEYTKGGSQ